MRNKAITEEIKYLKRLAKKIRETSFNVKVNEFFKHIKFQDCKRYVIINYNDNIYSVSYYDRTIMKAGEEDKQITFDKEDDLLSFLKELYDAIRFYKVY